MHDDNLSFNKSQHSIVIRCAICKKIISNSDLIYISPDESEEFIAHFNCYVELQDKICSECGKPFFDKEKLLYCEKHKEYFHIKRECIRNHLEKHIQFKQAYYDASNNRIILQELLETLPDF
ncbi:MAG: hypothetical protein FK731_04215 [Asgard group archaeon]|nr:hypothetical protein [Asgard group archaeon]